MRNLLPRAVGKNTVRPVGASRRLSKSEVATTRSLAIPGCADDPARPATSTGQTLRGALGVPDGATVPSVCHCHEVRPTERNELDKMFAHHCVGERSNTGATGFAKPLYTSMQPLMDFKRDIRSTTKDGWKIWPRKSRRIYPEAVDPSRRKRTSITLGKVPRIEHRCSLLYRLPIESPSSK
uniref:Uncharacterized protein n=1 Tax=Trichuris muris TaxID=70415 RepID=A0A5S6QGJ3_TRIMR